MTVAEWWQDLDGMAGVILAIVALITAVGSILGARWAYLSRQHAKGAEDQVANDHKSNLRDDIDDMREALHELAINVARVAGVADAVRSQGHQIGEIKRDILAVKEDVRDVRADLRDAVQRHEDDVKRLEN